MRQDLNFLLGNRIKEIRKNLKLTQDKLAELVEIDAKHLSRIECGKTPPSLNLLKKIALKLKIDISEFFITQHFKSKKELISEINLILNDSDLDKVQIFYKILKSFNR